MTTGAWRVAAAASTTLALGLPGVLIAANGVPAPRPAAPALSQPDAATEAAVASMAKAPLSFEPNVGQAEPGTAFVARGLAHSLSLEPDAATLTTGNSAVRMRLVGGDPGARVQGRHQLEGRINYLVGNDPAKWRSDVATYAQVAHEQVWPGIDLVWHEARSDALEYDFVVAPGADPNAIAVRFEGATGLRLDGGDLVVSTDGGELRQHAPVLYQDAGGRRLPVDGRFTLDGDTVRFSAGAYDPSMPLVIDPTLVYSTYLGETSGEARNDHGNDIAVDSAGAAYVTGETCSTGFPVTSLAYQKTKNAACDAFVTKFSPTQGTGVGTGLVYSTYLGSSGGDEGLQIAVDSAKNAYVIGEAATDFPTTPGAYQTSGTLYTSSFLAKLNKGGGKLLYSTYLGDANVRGLALGPALPATPTQPTVYVDGYGGDAATADAFQTTCNLNDSGSCSDIWLARLNAVGGGSSDVVYATYLGGTGGDDPDPSPGGSLVVDGAGRVYLGGNTTSTDFPLAGANGSFDTTKLVPSNCPTPPCAVHPGGFVALIDPSLPADGTGVPSATNQQLVWST
ncbi:MAG TPA: SBBP repeat-containing protein, partial [Acidimicrobiales bacterium]|nr:SBBP repeat-containing protein [Acidimicrobiales bacterium]